MTAFTFCKSCCVSASLSQSPTEAAGSHVPCFSSHLVIHLLSFPGQRGAYDREDEDRHPEGPGAPVRLLWVLGRRGTEPGSCHPPHLSHSPCAWPGEPRLGAASTALCASIGMRNATNTTPRSSCTTCTPRKAGACLTAGLTCWATCSRYNQLREWFPGPSRVPISIPCSSLGFLGGPRRERKRVSSCNAPRRCLPSCSSHSQHSGVENVLISPSWREDCGAETQAWHLGPGLSPHFLGGGPSLCHPVMSSWPIPSPTI